MPICPLCSSRPAKRFCPAKDLQICSVCCGTKREIEIDCPSHCSYLKAGRDYEAERIVPDPELVARSSRFDQMFIIRSTPVLNLISQELLSGRKESSWLVDADVIAVFKALTATMKTLNSGIYYESTPEGPVRQSLFRRLKRLLDHLMSPQQDLLEATLRPSEAVDVLEFLTLSVQAGSSVRPKSRRYLDWLLEQMGVAADEPQSGLILP